MVVFRVEPTKRKSMFLATPEKYLHAKVMLVFSLVRIPRIMQHIGTPLTGVNCGWGEPNIKMIRHLAQANLH